MKIQIRSTETNLSFIEVLAVAFYFITEINVELFVNRPIYIAAVLFLVFVILTSNQCRVRINSYLIWIILWTFMVFFSLIYSVSRSTTMTALLTVGARGLVFVVLLSRINSYDVLVKIIKILIIAEIANLMYILNHINIMTIGSVRIGAKSISTDSDATWNSNSISTVLVSCVIYAACLLKNNRIKYRKLMIIVCIFFCIIILLCGSRTGLLLLLGIPLMWYTLSSDKRNLFFRIMGIIAGIIIFYFVIMYIPSFYKVLGRRVATLIRNLLGQNVTDLSIKGRSAMIVRGIKWFEKRPLFGYGMYTFKYLYGKNYGRTVYAHNSYIEILVGTGMVGLITYYWIYLKMIFEAQACKYKHWQIVLSSIVVIMIAELATVSFKNFTIQFALMILYALIRISKKDSEILLKNT